MMKSLENIWDDEALECHVSLGAWVVGWVEENHCADLLLVAGYDDGGCDDESYDDGGCDDESCDDGGCDDVCPWLVAEELSPRAYN